jgi:hypothetical protein
VENRYLIIPKQEMRRTHTHARAQGVIVCSDFCSVCVRVLVGRPEGKRPLERPRRGWEDGIRTYLNETGWGTVEWNQLAQDRNQWRALVNRVMYLRVLAPRSQSVSQSDGQSVCQSAS